MTTKRLGAHPRSTEAVIHDETVYLPVITAKDFTPSVTDQTRQVLRQIEERLAACGTDKYRILSATVIVTDQRIFDEMNAVWDNWVPWHDPPVCTFLVSRLAPEGRKVGIQLTVAQ